MTALITGGSRGIGRAIVERFAAAGHAVAFTYSSNQEAADALVECVKSKGGSAAAFRADVRDFARATEVMKEAQASLGPITALINNAGIKKDAPLMRMDPSAWQDVIDTNLTGTFNYTRVLIGEMVRRGGSIVNITSASGVIGMAGQTNYSASKAGVIGFTRALAKEVVRFEVRVNAIAPGFIETDMTASIDEATRRKLYGGIPMGRAGSAQDIAKLALYLAGDDAKYVTGQVWNVDGGLT
ncbi:MAG TPA: 3-oxoacyl-ACP reductase FabG [Bryobacteraceae bacterium]|nr:3-oxoacyl-ACP reductase FabG [Bryobacteraceae bacterium]